MGKKNLVAKNLMSKRYKPKIVRPKKGEGSFINGKEDGLWIGWWEKGQKWSEDNYQDGDLHGLSTKWHENGQKMNEGSFKDGKEEGKCYLQFPKMNMDRLPFYEAKVLFSEGRGRM